MGLASVLDDNIFLLTKTKKSQSLLKYFVSKDKRLDYKDKSASIINEEILGNSLPEA